jgi:DNA-directed RNA polymerase specialized sigma24 family protein
MQEDIAEELLRSGNKRIQSLIRAGVPLRDAEDALGEAWLKLNGHEVKDGGSATGLVIRTFQSIGIDKHRGEKRKRTRHAIELDAPDSIEPISSKHASTSNFDFNREHYALVRETLASLGIHNPLDQNVLFLDIIGFSDEEGAFHLNINLTQYKSRLSRVRRRISNSRSSEEVIDLFETNLSLQLLESSDKEARYTFAKIFSQSIPQTFPTKPSSPKKYSTSQLPSDIVELRKEFAFEVYRHFNGNNAPKLASAIREVALRFELTFGSARDIIYGHKSLSPSRLERYLNQVAFHPFAHKMVVLLNPNPSEKLYLDPKRLALSRARRSACALFRKEIQEFCGFKDTEIILRLFGLKTIKHAESILLGSSHISVQGKLQSTQFCISKLGVVSQNISESLLCFLPPDIASDSNLELGQRVSTLTIMSAVEYKDNPPTPLQYAQSLFDVSPFAADQIVNRSKGDLGFRHARKLIEKYVQLGDLSSNVIEKLDPSCFFHNTSWYKRLIQDSEITLSAHRRLLVIALGIAMQRNTDESSNIDPRKIKKIFEILTYDLFHKSGVLHGPILGESHLNLFEISQLKILLSEACFEPAAASIFLPHGQAWCTSDMVSQFRRTLSNVLVDGNKPLAAEQRYRLRKGLPAKKESIDYLNMQIEKQPDWMRALLDPMSLEIVYTFTG